MTEDELTDIEMRLRDCEEAMRARNNTFSPWERDFLKSIQEQFESKKFLSAKQVDILDKCWEKI